MIIGLMAAALILVISVIAWPWLAYFTSDNEACGGK